jgi:hypothetical protein
MNAATVRRRRPVWRAIRQIPTDGRLHRSGGMVPSTR